ncbi:BTB/POZ domain-containing protein 9-like protein, partial [Leptotrombidium deliense]
MIRFEEQTIDDWQEAFDDITASQYDAELQDIQFLCEETVFMGNKLIIQTVSDYWKNHFRQHKDATLIELTDVKSNHFAQIFEYMYTGKIKFETLEQAMQLVRLIKHYKLNRLYSDILELIQYSVSLTNVWHLFQTSVLTEDIEEIFLKFLDSKATETVKTTEVLHLSYNVFEKVISRDTFSASETEIFEMTKKWLQRNPSHKE